LTDKKVKAPNESFYQLYGYNFLHDEMTVNEIKMDDKFLTDVGISPDNLNKKIVVAGFYSDKTTYSTAGVFYFSVDEDSTSQTTVKSGAFSPGFLSKFLGDGPRRVADAVDNPLQFFARGAQVSRPVPHFVVLVHVDLASVRLASVESIVCHHAVLLGRCCRR
jgi:hypothetical protein